MSNFPSEGDEAVPVSLGVVGWLRWGWRQLTSMRTALVLLLLLAIAAIPGSIVPQRSADPNGVSQYRADHPDLFPVLDGLQLFDVYTSAWFSAIYLLLFVSLIGCVIPRTKHHWKALRSRPPRTPARLSRLDDYLKVDAGTSAGDAASVVGVAEGQLRRLGYRVQRYDAGPAASVSAERGYLRETGNLVFHASLVGVLLSVGIGGGFTYTGQTVVLEGESFVNSLGMGFSSFNPGRFIDDESLPPYSLTLDRFDVSYVPYGEPGQGQAGDFAAHLTVAEPGRDKREETVRVNHPLTVAGDQIYLMGNGYAPMITVRDPAGEVVFREPVKFLPQDTFMTSQGVVKVADGLDDQLGMVGFFYPSAVELESGALSSAWPELLNPIVSFWVYAGDLGIDGGIPRNVYALDPTGMEQIAGPDADDASIVLGLGESAEIPGGRGTITFENMLDEGHDESVLRYVSLSVHRDVSAPWVLAFAVLAILGLLAGLFVPRRRMWVRATPDGDALTIEYAGLARGEDPAIARAVADLAREHADALGIEPVGADAGSAAGDGIHRVSP